MVPIKYYAIFALFLAMMIKSLSPFLPLFLIILVSCKHIKDPEFKRLENFRVKKIGLRQSSIGFSVTYYNPNNFGVTAKEAAAEIYVDSIYIGKFIQDSAIKVNKASEFSIPLTGDISLENALTLNFQNLPKRDIYIKADGYIKIGKGGFYVTRPVKYEGNIKLDNIKF